MEAKLAPDLVNMRSFTPWDFDRALRRGVAAARAFARDLDTDPTVTAATLDDELESIANREVLGWLSELPESEPIRGPGLRWLHWLIDVRVNAKALLGVAHALRWQSHRVPSPRAVEASVNGLLQLALEEPQLRSAWLRALEQNAMGLYDASIVLWERRQELAERVGLSSFRDSGPLPQLEPATHWERDRDLLEACGIRDLPSLVSIGLAGEASEGWPAHLNARTVTQFFGDWLDGLPLVLPSMPRALGPASFLRAFNGLGRAFVRASAPEAIPFCLAQDPHGLGEHEGGALMDWIAMSPAFVRRSLGLGAGRFGTARRALAKSLYLEVRLAALRVAMAQCAMTGDDRLGQQFETLSHDCVGVALPRELALVLPRPRFDSDARYVALLLSASRYLQFRNAYDDDFYRNPRAIEHLRGEAAMSPRIATNDDEVKAGLADVRTLVAEALD